MTAAPAQRWNPEDQVWDPTPFLQAGRSGAGRRCIFDIESNGLFRASGRPGQARYIQASTKLWCIGAVDVDTGEEFYWGVDLGPDSLSAGAAFLAQCDTLLAHNGIGYDYPDMEKHFPGWRRPTKSWDTLVMAKVIWPYDALIGPDLSRIKAGTMPAKYLKSHSLAAWGYRTGTHKGEYTGGFEEWKPSMAVYMMGDVRGTLPLWKLIERRLGWDPDSKTDLRTPDLTIEVEHEVARIIFEQECDGVRFDLPRANALKAELLNEQARLERELKALFGSWWQPLCDPEEGEEIGATMRKEIPGTWKIERRFGKTGKELKPYEGPCHEERTKGDRHVPIEWTTFNPGSRDHLGMRLQAVYGWKPKKFGKNGKPTVDESVLEEIPEAVLPADVRRTIMDYFVVAKTLGTLAKGAKAWLNIVDEDDGRIHGRMDTCGAVTRRGTHKDPNLSGTPSVRKEKVIGDDGQKREVVVRGLRGRYGWECRELFLADQGWELTGVDASSLELIDLGHYLYPADAGAFSARVCDPTRDAHQEHSEICGTTRADAKTTIYLFVYGGSAYKLSLDPGIIVTQDMVPELLNYRGLPMLLRSLEKRFDEDFVLKLDDMQKARIARSRIIIVKLEEGIPGLKQLKESVSKAAERGWLKAIDGSKVHVRKAHAALNSLLQSAGAISCKLWMHLVHRELRRRGYVRGRDFKQVLWVHDELQITHRPGLGPIIKEVAEQCLVEAGEMLGLRGRYRTDGKTGSNWAECH